jgi:serine/threonine protein kinase
LASISSIGVQILEGLHWIHSKGFLFVDVKPDNFMLKKDRLYFVDC